MNDISTHTPDAPEPAAEAAETKPCHTLLVDDESDFEPMISTRFRRLVRSGQYQLSFADDGVEALEKLAANPDIKMVVTDINMPHMNGLRLLEEIRERHADVITIMLSAYGEMPRIRQAMNSGAFDFCTKPPDFDDLQATMIKSQAQANLKTRAHSQELQMEKLQAELDIAREIQQAVMPENDSSAENFQAHGTMLPARNISGDFYALIPLGHGHTGLAVDDVSDKDIPAAPFMMSSSTILKSAAIGTQEPAQVVAEINNQVSKDNRNTMFVTLLYAVYDPATGQLAYCNAGHTEPPIVDQHGSVRILRGSGNLVVELMGEWNTWRRPPSCSPARRWSPIPTGSPKPETWRARSSERNS